MKQSNGIINKYKFQILSFMAILILVFAVYYGTTSSGFIYLDDDALILNRVEQMDSFSKAGNFLLQPVFESAQNKFYRPVLNLSLFIDTVISGGEAGFYHYTNVLLHVIAVFLVFLFFCALGYSGPISLGISFLYAVHPALTSAVAWIPGRNDSLLAVSVLLSCILFIKNFKTDKAVYLVVSSFFFLTALLTKETAVAIPVIFILYVWLFEKAPYKKNVEKFVLWAVVPVFLYVLFRFITMSKGIQTVSSGQIAANVIVSSLITFWYTGVVFFTEKIILYPQIDVTLGAVLRGLAPLCVLGSVAYFFRKKTNFMHILFGLFWFCLFLVPTYAMPDNNFYTHRLYIPIIGMFIVLIEAIKPVYETFPKTKTLFTVLLCVLIALLGFMSYKQSLFYADRGTFWLQALNESPESARVNAGAARYYETINENEKAVEYSLKALGLAKNTDIPRIMTQTGKIYFFQGNLNEAVKYYTKSIELEKYSEGAYFGLSQIYQKTGQKEKAIEILNAGIEAMPGNKTLQKRLKAVENDEKEIFSSLNFSFN